MKVAAVHNLKLGGAHRRLSEQLSNLEATVVEVCLSTAVPITAEAIVVPYRPLAPRVAPALRPPLRYLDLARLERAWRWAAAAVGEARPDVVFASPCRFLQAPAALLRMPAPSLYHCDEPRERSAVLAATRNPRTRILYGRLHAAESRLDRAAVAQATALTTSSHFSATEIRRLYRREAAVLPMGIPAGFTPSWEPVSHLFSVGSLIPDKGHELVLRATALAHTRRPLLIVSPHSNPPEERRLLGLASELGVELTIRVGISDAELVEAYRRAHATLYLAREEPFGLASLEAQACGSPVIVSDTGGLPETLRPESTGWAVARSAAAVAERLDLLDDPELRRRMARAAAAFASEATWARATRELQRLLEALCASSADRRGGARSTS